MEINGGKNNAGGVLITDTYCDSKTKNIMSGKEINEFQKLVTALVLVEYDKQAKKNPFNENDKTKDIRRKFSNCIRESETYNDLIENLKRVFVCKSIECIYSNALLAYNGGEYSGKKLALLIRAFNVCGRILHMDKPTEWLDNWRINAFGHIYSFIMWSEYDNENAFTLNREFKPIRENVKIDFERYLKFCVGCLRAFLISFGLYPCTNVAEFMRGKDYRKLPRKEMSAREICDECYKKFPINYIGSHGCNALFEGGYTCYISDISTYLDRYPAAIFEGSMNTSSYGSSGEHWTTVAFFNK